MRTIVPTLLIVSVTAALASACQPPVEPAPKAEPAAPAAPSAPASAPASDVPPPAEGEPRWMARQEGENRVLAFAVPETDDVRLVLECGPGERFVRLWRETGEEDSHDFRLSSGEASATYPAEYEPEGMAPQLKGVAPGRAPVFVQFRETGKLTLTTQGGSHDLSAHASAMGQVADFFDYCMS